MFEDAQKIINGSIKAVLPDAAVGRALSGRTFPGRVFVLAIGKAGWQMAKAAEASLGETITRGIVITKYDHVKGEINRFECFEAGHPVPDGNSFSATDEAIGMVRDLKESDTVLFLISGGGSALFEKPLVSAEELADITGQLLACGADITEINTIRKRISAVKGGKFAKLCEPAHVTAIVLSDILGDPLDMIASGPAFPDSSSCEDALRIVRKYDLKLSAKALDLLRIETPKRIDNVDSMITGSVSELCKAAENICSELGYETHFLTDKLSCEAKEAGEYLAGIAMDNQHPSRPQAFICGGETVVHLHGNGKGGRNQELALSASKLIAGAHDTIIFSVGSDGTDGPTDAAGGIVSGETYGNLRNMGLKAEDFLENNDAYNALKKCDGLIITGPTGTNVNDLSVALVK